MITASTLTVDAEPQADGRTWVVERHATNDGRGVLEFRYLAAEGLDCNAVMASRAAAYTNPPPPPEEE